MIARLHDPFFSFPSMQIIQAVEEGTDSCFLEVVLDNTKANMRACHIQ